MAERRTDHTTRKRVAEMSSEEMRHALLVSEKADLPNKRAFDESERSPFVAMADVDGLKMLNDHFGYSAGDILIKRFAETLTSVGFRTPTTIRATNSCVADKRIGSLIKSSMLRTRF